MPKTLDQLVAGDCRYVLPKRENTEPATFCAEPTQGRSAFCPCHHSACYVTMQRKQVAAPIFLPEEPRPRTR